MENEFKKINNIVLDVTNKKGITSVCVVYKGSVVERSTYESKFDNQYENLIKGYITGIRLVNRLISKNDVYSESELLVVSSNKALLTWFNKGYSLPKYSEMFKVFIDSVETIPLRVEYIWSNNLVSEKFALKSMINSVEVAYSVSDLDD